MRAEEFSCILVNENIMTSPAPLAYDTYYHIYNRGNNRENIFIQERNYAHFMRLYWRYLEQVAETFAFCLLRNHFHLVVRIRSIDEIFNGKKMEGKAAEHYPSKKFSDFFNAYAKAINQAYGRTGSLFQHPFGRVPITTNQYFSNVVAYVHQNPQKHELVRDFREWKWSSYGIILTEKPTNVRRDIVLDWFGGLEGYKSHHEQFALPGESEWFAVDD